MCWIHNVITFEPATSADGRSTAMLILALDSEMQAWNAALAECNAPRLRRSAPQSLREMRRDGRSVVLIKAGRWCADGARDQAACYERTSAAKTHVYPSFAAGGCDELREADIEINGADYQWSVNGDTPGTRSLRAILAHELGHALGLGEACGPTQKGDRADCTKHDATHAIMYPAPVEPGRQAVLAPAGSEAATLCDLYRPVKLLAPTDDPGR